MEVPRATLVIRLLEIVRLVAVAPAPILVNLPVIAVGAAVWLEVEAPDAAKIP